ncbi:MAG: ribonuclease III [Oscillospiraceae bacterium]|nr:ribonuclease III [Oscillospiraceae bacterium]
MDELAPVIAPVLTPVLSPVLAPVLAPAELHRLSSLALAHVGDAAFEIMVRVRLCLAGHVTAAKLHEQTVAHVRAGAQATYARALWPHLSEGERAVFLRGRNAETHTQPHAATREEYAQATALEALWGYLYLTGRQARLEELFAKLPIANVNQPPSPSTSPSTSHRQ